MMGWSWVFLAPRLGLAGEDDQSFLDKKEEKEKGKKRSAADSEGPLGLCKSSEPTQPDPKYFLSFSHVV